MFKAIGRWGSSVRSSINVHIFANIFGSKSKKYGDLGNEDEEIFIDALETIDHDTDTEEDVDDTHAEHIKSEIRDTKLDTTDGNAAHESDDLNESNTTNDPFTTKAEIVKIIETETEVSTEMKEQNTEQTSSHEESEKRSSSDSEIGDTDDEKSENEHELNDDDDNHVNHKDTKKMIVNSSKPNNGIVHSASSSSVMKKVHRRMNSYSQRQYAKFDNSQDDENDTVVHSADKSTKDNEEIHQVVDDNIQQSQAFKTEKKTKKKKVAFFNFFRGFFRSKSTRIR